MGLKCSLLGHDYGSLDVRRDRDERGDEVVVTVREVETCARCGAETVVSENTEVRSLEPADADSDPAPDADRDATDPAQAPSASQEGAAARESGGFGGAGVGSGIDEALATDPPAEDDAVILDDEEDTDPDPDRASGEWPNADDTRLEEADRDANEPTAWPESGRATDTEDDTEETPDDPDVAPREADTEFVGTDTSAAADEPTGIVSAGPVENGGAAREDGATTEAAPEADEPNADLVCPACDFRESLPGSSKRAGDICPDCRRGYLTRR